MDDHQEFSVIRLLWPEATVLAEATLRQAVVQGYVQLRGDRIEVTHRGQLLHAVLGALLAPPADDAGEEGSLRERLD